MKAKVCVLMTALSIVFGSAQLATGASEIVPDPDGPILNQPIAGDAVVTGQAISPSIPLRLLDITSTPSFLLGGTGSLAPETPGTFDDEGNFAIPVNSPLFEGQVLVGLDEEGRYGPPVEVIAPTSPAASE